ncbi:MAG: carboxypeptidase-like regulatory domain-containing protein [Oceanicaulis sp.]
MKNLTLILAVAIGLAGCAHAPDTIAVSGTVYDLTGAPVADAEIAHEHSAARARTGENGRFVIDLPAPRGRWRSWPMPRLVLYDLRAETATQHGLTSAMAPSGREPYETLFILLPSDEVARSQTLLDRRSPACGAGAGRAYAHTFLDEAASLIERGWLPDLEPWEARFGLSGRLEQLVTGAVSDCELTQDNWTGDLQSLRAVFAPAVADADQ